MTFEVTKHEKFGTRLSYSVSDEGRYVGLAIVHYNQRKAFWKYVSPVGTLITDNSTRRAMDAAITRFHDATQR